jgi:hypothetical protein
MPFQLEIIRATEFVRVGAEGHFDLPASKEALATLANSCRKRGTENAILDLRALEPAPKPVFTPKDLLELVNTFPEMGFDKHRLRLAILYRIDPHKRARLFSFLTALHGWNVQTFDNFEEALLWLSRGQEAQSRPQRSQRETQIPVRFSGSVTSRDVEAAPVARKERVPSGRKAPRKSQPRI